jgi:hypothetical protein
LNCETERACRRDPYGIVGGRESVRSKTTGEANGVLENCVAYIERHFRRNKLR